VQSLTPYWTYDRSGDDALGKMHLHYITQVTSNPLQTSRYSMCPVNTYEPSVCTYNLSEWMAIL